MSDIIEIEVWKFVIIAASCFLMGIGIGFRLLALFVDYQRHRTAMNKFDELERKVKERT